MKYLNRREEFLKQYNKIVNIKESYRSNFSNRELIKEDSGPFANNIGWGDSLLGRLINSTIRKAKIGTNLVRIKAVEQRLRDAMDEILLTSSVAELDENDKKLYAKALITTYLLALQEAVENGDPLDELKSLTNTAINAVEQNEDIENKNELLRQLNEWLKFLNEFEEEDSEDSEDSENSNSKDPNITYINNFKYLFNILLIYKGIELEKLEYNRNKSANNTNKTESEFEVGKEYIFTNKEGRENTVKIISLDKTRKAGPDREFLTKDDIIGTDAINKDAVFVAFKDDKGLYKNTMSVSKNKLKPLDPSEATTGGGDTKKTKEVEVHNNSIIVNYDEFRKINEGVTKSIGRLAGKVWKFFNGEDEQIPTDKDTEKLWNSLKPLYQLFNTEKGTLERDSEFHRFLKLTPEQISSDVKLKLVYNKYKSNIDKIYKSIRSLNGISEGVHELLGKSEQMSKYINGLYSVTKTKPNGDFKKYPGVVLDVWDELIDNIKGFNESMKTIFELESKWNIGDTVKWKSEKTGNIITKEIEGIDGKKLIFKDKEGKEYSKFMSEVEKVEESLLFEDVDPTDINDDEENTNTSENEETTDNNSQVSGWKNPSSVGKIQDWWSKNMDLKKWVVEKTEVEKIRVNLDKKLAEKKDSIVINGMDPILEIVKVFNRAYKLHTTQVIPSGRTGGKVSNKTFMEYHSFGGGTPETAGASGGPYRNIAIFNQWEDCVLDIKKDKKYQPIFNVGTRIKVGNEYIDKAGSNLRKFMTDMLDGDELYKGGTGKEQGAQAKFLDKYFGYKAEVDGKDTYYDGDKEAVNETANGINPIMLATSEANTTIKYNKESDLKNTFFLLRLKNDGESKTYYFYVQDVRDGVLYLTYSLTAYHIIKYVKKSKGDVLVKSNFVTVDKKDKNGKEYPIKVTTIELRKLYKNDGAFALSTEIEISSIIKQRDSNDEVDNSISNKNYELEDSKKYKVERAQHIISKSDDETRIKVNDKGVYDVMKTDGGYENIHSIVNIKNAKITNR